MKGFAYETYDGLGLAELVKKKEVSPRELVEGVIERIEALNPEINAVIHKMYDQAREASVREMTGRFAGVPMLLKDITQEMKGIPITSGSKALQNYRPKEDSEYVRRLKKAGLIFLGKTNVPEFGLMAITEPTHYGPSRNPWNISYTPGGSSGGSGAAVAAGIVPIAGASDGGGSIRIPAAYCGLFGMKPTRGRSPVGPRYGRLWQGAAVEHVLTRSVRDSAAILEELKGFEKSAAFSVAPYEKSYLETINTPNERTVRIAFSLTSPIGTEVDPECKEAVLKTVNYLETMGHHVEEVDAPVDGKKIANSYLTMYFGEVAATLSGLEEVLGRKVSYKDVEPTSWLLGLLGKATTAEEFVLSLRAWDEAAYAMETFHETYTYYITPTTAFPPAKIADHDPKPMEKLLMNVSNRLGSGVLLKRLGIVEQLAEDSLKRVPFTQLANLTGQPAMSLPLHMTADGLPVGVQFMAAQGREDLLFTIAAQMEKTELWQELTKNPTFTKV
ncbi:amidase family protein [Anaerobacillus sp. MEB173]|uniref:amidase family protein n=1 Tax=Anaerobacillus sp. MEB173 TaxID=3383345 RepID=UPI003F90B5BE